MKMGFVILRFAHAGDEMDRTDCAVHMCQCRHDVGEQGCGAGIWERLERGHCLLTTTPS